MRVPFLDLQRRVASLQPELGRAVDAVLESGPYVLGPVVEAFEAEFAAYCGAAEAIGVASGTDAITLGLLALGVVPGDEVITTANTGVPTVAGIEAAGAKPVLVDSDPVTRTMDVSRLPDAIRPHTRALVPIHLYGRVAPMQEIVTFARKRGLAVLEDCAQAVGADLDGARAGTLADAAAFSFYPTKNLGALGDGGAVVTGDPVIAERVRMLRTYGEERRYWSVLSGRNSRLDPMQAAILRVQLERLDEWNERRRAIAAHYDRRLSATDLRLPDPVSGHVYHLYVVESSDRDTLSARLDEAGIGTLVHYPTAVHLQPAFARLAHDGLRTAERLCKQVLSLPLYPELSDYEVEAVTEAVVASAT